MLELSVLYEQGKYVEVSPGERLRYVDRFDDPGLPGEMRIAIDFSEVSCGTELNILQEGITAAIPANMAEARIDRLFRALADETRLRILHLVGKGEVCVCDIRDVLQAPQRKVSRHLGYLRRSGLVSDRRQGPWRYYSLAPAKTVARKKLLACLDGCWNEMPAVRRDAEKLRSLRRRPCRIWRSLGER